jgi:DNA-binding transcriptional MerR regulator
MDALIPIREVADHFDLPLSTLHYWERRGLIQPLRRAGQRVFDTEQFYRTALVVLWRTTGMMSLDEIATVMAGHTGQWRDTVLGRVSTIEAQMEKLDTARTYLNHLLTCRHEKNFEKCPEFRDGFPLPQVRA